jgi:hypothetical protein
MTRLISPAAGVVFDAAIAIHVERVRCAGAAGQAPGARRPAKKPSVGGAGALRPPPETATAEGRRRNVSPWRARPPS